MHSFTQTTVCFLFPKFLSGTKTQRDAKSISPEEKVIYKIKLLEMIWMYVSISVLLSETMYMAKSPDYH